jgi:hypothetical protein
VAADEPSAPDEEVGGLDVPVDDAPAVGRVQGVGNLYAEIHDLRWVEGATADAVLERVSLQELHGDEGPSFVLVDVVDRADVGMVEGRGGPGLPPEPLQRGVASEEPVGKELERDRAAEAGVLGLVDDAHPSAAELLDDPVMGDRLTDHVARAPVQGRAPCAREGDPWHARRRYDVAVVFDTMVHPPLGPVRIGPLVDPMSYATASMMALKIGLGRMAVSAFASSGR